VTKALIVYGTRYGATASTSEDIAKVLRQEGLDVNIVNLKNAKVKDISDYDLFIVGSGIKINKWTKEPENFIKKYQEDLAKSKVALFVCCGSAEPLDEKEDKAKTLANARTKYLEEKAAKYHLQPIALGLFGGVYNFNKMGWFFRKSMSAVKPQLEAAGFKETEPGLFDTRDVDTIRGWAKEVADLVQS
jgi:menaquinone-dependent protoporphyrinogen oxidase